MTAPIDPAELRRLAYILRLLAATSGQVSVRQVPSGFQRVAAECLELHRARLTADDIAFLYGLLQQATINGPQRARLDRIIDQVRTAA